MLFKKILCPTDFSQASFIGLKKAVELATDANTEICVIHVESALPSRLPVDGVAPFAHTEAERCADTVAHLCAVVTENVPSSVRARPLLKKGEAAQQILCAAREEAADLIVLSTHGAGNVGADSLGRVAEEVLRSAPCLVLTVKAATGEPADTAPHNGMPHSYDNMPAALEMVSSKAIFLDGD